MASALDEAKSLYSRLTQGVGQVASGIGQAVGGIGNFIQRYPAPINYLLNQKAPNNQTFGQNISQGLSSLRQVPQAAYQGVVKPSLPYLQQYGQAFMQDVGTAATGALKLSPPYQAYRAITGNPISAQENLGNLANTAFGAGGAAWRLNPAAPATGAVFGGLQALRQSGGNINQGLLGAQQGVVSQPFIGQALTDNPQQAGMWNLAALPIQMLMGKGLEKSGLLKKAITSAEEGNYTIKLPNNRILTGLTKEELAGWTQNLDSHGIQYSVHQAEIPGGMALVSGKKPTYAEASKLIQKEGGFINAKSLPAVNRYAADEIAGGMGLNPKYIYEQATDKGINLKDYLLRMDATPDIHEKIKISQEMMGNLSGKVQSTLPKSLEPVTKVKQLVETPQPLKEVPEVSAQIRQPQTITAKPLPTEPMGLTGGNGGQGGSSTKSITPVVNSKNPFYNVERMGVEQQSKQLVKQTVEEVKPAIEQVVGKTMSNKEVIDTAAKTSATLQTTIGREQTLAIGAKALNLRNKLADLAQKGTVDEEFIKTLIQDKAFGTDVARLLQQRNIISDPSKGTLISKILDNVLKNNQNTDEILQAARGVDFNNAEQATKFYRTFVKPKLGDWVDTLRYNSMLSSPNTHINNISSNIQGTGIITPIEKTVTGMIDFLSSKVTGKSQKYYPGEGVVYAKGYWSNLNNAAHKFSDVMSGKDLSSTQEIHNIPLTTGGVSRMVEKVISYPARLLQASDEFFQTLTESGVKRSLEYRVSKGVNVKDIGAQAYLEGRKRLFNAEFNLPEEGPILKALEYIPQEVMKARNSNNPVVRTIAKFTFPFVRIPSNILKQGLEYSPLGLTTIPGAMNKTEQLSKAIMGTSIGVGAATLLGSGRLSWAEPTDQKKKDAFRAAGMQPYSIKIGNNWISYSKLHPAIAFNLALVSALKDQQDKKLLDDSQTDTVLKGLSKWVQFFADQSYVKNIGDFISSAKGDIEGPARYFANYPQQLIPFRALMGWVTRIVDPVQRRADPKGDILTKQFQQIATQIPGLSQSVPARTDQNGNPIPIQHPLLNAVSPARVSTENQQGVDYYNQLKQKSQQTKQMSEFKNQAESAFQKGQISYQKGNYVFVKDGDQIKTIDTSFTPKQPALSGHPELDKKLISQYSSQINKKMNDITALYQVGKISAQEANQQLDTWTQVKDTIKPVKQKSIRTPRAPRISRGRGLRVSRVRALSANRLRLKKIKLPKIKNTFKPFKIKGIKRA